MTILPPTLHFLHLPKSSLWPCMPAVTHALLLQDQTDSGATFIHYTETLDEVSLLVDTRTYRRLVSCLPSGVGVRVSPHTFRAISVSEGEIESMASFDVTTGLVSAISSVLAAAAISIFYVSTFQTDYVVIKTVQVARATDVLKQQFGEDNVDVEDAGARHEEEEDGYSDDAANEGATSNARTYQAAPTLAQTSAPCNSPSPVAPDASSALALAVDATISSPLLLYALPQTFFLTHLGVHDLPRHLPTLMRLFFFPPTSDASCSSSSPSSDRFFSYSNIDSSVCMMVDPSSLSLVSGGITGGVSFERWRGIQVALEFGFDECGIVAALSGPLTQRKICPFYLSTYSTDYVLVQEGKWPDAESILSDKFQFVPRTTRRQTHTELTATQTTPAGSAHQSAAVSAGASPQVTSLPQVNETGATSHDLDHAAHASFFATPNLATTASDVGAVDG